jgi:hypothetical protein
MLAGSAHAQDALPLESVKLIKKATVLVNVKVGDKLPRAPVGSSMPTRKSATW